MKESAILSAIVYELLWCFHFGGVGNVTDVCRTCGPMPLIFLHTVINCYLLTYLLIKEGKGDIFENCRSTIQNDEDLDKIWRNLCGKTISYEDSKFVFDHMLKRYLMVRHKQFLKDTKSHYNVLKKKRLREELEKKKAKKCDVNERPSTSKEQTPKKKTKRAKTPSKGKGRGKGRPKKVKYYCGLCEAEYNINEDWIQCDECNIWYHRDCAGLESDEAWDQMQDTDVEYKCHQCR